MCTASSLPLCKEVEIKDSAAALHPTLPQMPSSPLRSLQEGLQMSPKALLTTTQHSKLLLNVPHLTCI